MSDAEPRNEVENVEVDAIKVAPGTDDVVSRSDLRDITTSVREHDSDGGCTIAASAWDGDGIGVGGVAIRIPETARKQLGAALLQGEFDGE